MLQAPYWERISDFIRSVKFIKFFKLISIFSFYLNMFYVNYKYKMDNPIYRKAIAIVNEQYGTKTSAYRSMAIVKKYKELGGKYKDTKKEDEGVTRWLKEKWVQVGPI